MHDSLKNNLCGRDLRWKFLLNRCSRVNFAVVSGSADSTQKNHSGVFCFFEERTSQEDVSVTEDNAEVAARLVNRARMMLFLSRCTHIASSTNENTEPAAGRSTVRQS